MYSRLLITSHPSNGVFFPLMQTYPHRSDILFSDQILQYLLLPAETLPLSFSPRIFAGYSSSFSAICITVSTPFPPALYKSGMHWSQYDSNAACSIGLYLLRHHAVHDLEITSITPSLIPTERFTSALSAAAGSSSRFHCSLEYPHLSE